MTPDTRTQPLTATGWVMEAGAAFIDQWNLLSCGKIVKYVFVGR